MKKILLLSFFNFSLLIVNCFSQQYGWVALNPPSIAGTPNLSDLFFINADTGWINSNTANSIFYTVDGSGSFATQSIASTIDAIHMIDANNGYAAADDGSIYRTTSGGTNWNFLAPTFTNLNDISFPLTGSTATGYACGDNGAIYEVTSLGADVMTSGVVSDLKSITFPTATQGWTCGESVILHFSNGSWQGDQGYPTNTYNAVFFTDNQIGWAVGDNGIIIHTTDGQNWNAQTNPDPQSRSLYSVFFLNSDEGWAVGGNGIILHTTNGGTTWKVEANGLTTAFLTGVQFTSSTNGYVVGNNKTLLKYTLLTSLEDEEEQPTEFKLEQNYPNPFNPSTSIQYTIGSRQFVQLKVFDVLGNEIVTLVNEEKPAGTYDVEFQSTVGSQQLASGIYYYQLRAGKYLETKKMILLK
jgi:photosystem II stability/assembly factor-like uncharacterized protein